MVVFRATGTIVCPRLLERSDDMTVICVCVRLVRLLIFIQFLGMLSFLM